MYKAGHRAQCPIVNAGQRGSQHNRAEDVGAVDHRGTHDGDQCRELRELCRVHVEAPFWLSLLETVARLTTLPCNITACQLDEPKGGMPSPRVGCPPRSSTASPFWWSVFAYGG